MSGINSVSDQNKPEPLSPERILPVAQLIDPDAFISIRSKTPSIWFNKGRSPFNPHSPETCVKLIEWASNSPDIAITARMNMAVTKAIDLQEVIPESVFACVLKIVESKDD